MNQLLIGDGIVAVLLKASLVLALAQLAVSLLPRLPAAAKHLVLTAGLAAFVVVPLLAIAGPVWHVQLLTKEPVTYVAAPVVGVPLPMLPAQPHAPHFTALQIAALLWLAVTSIFVLRLLRTAWRLRLIVAHAVAPSSRLNDILDDVRDRLDVDAAVRLLRSARVHVPMVWGVRSGTLLVPEVAEQWSDEELRATFIHELGHLQRLDYVSLGLMNVVSALLWFHPQVWIARRRAMIEGERACDDLVLRAGERASQYASHLLHVARLLPRREPLGALLAMSRPSQLEGRMHAILSPSTNRRPLGARGVAVSLFAFAIAVLPIAFLELTAQTVIAPVRAQLARVVATPVAAPPQREMVTVAEVAPRSEAIELIELIEAAPATEPLEEITIATLPDSLELPLTVERVEAEPAIAERTTVEEIETPPTSGMRILTNAEFASGQYDVLKKLAGTSCTYRLRRPVNTGDPARNPAEALAMSRLLAKAGKQGADAVANVSCHRYIAIGITCPSGVECFGEAVVRKTAR